MDARVPMHAQNQPVGPDNYQQICSLAVALLNHWRDANALPVLPVPVLCE